MKEIKPGPYRQVPQNALPADAELLQALDSYRVFLSAAEQTLVIVTTSYHPGTLHISRSDLEGIVGKLRGAERAQDHEPCG